MKQILKNKRYKIDKEYNINKILYFLIDRPNKINYWNSFIWKNKIGQWHRDYDLPAYIGNNGIVGWWKNYKRYNRK